MNPSAFASEAALPARQPAAMQVLEFICRGQRFAVPLTTVRRAVLSARPVPLPGASEIVLGVLDVGGDTVTVLDFALRATGRPTVISPTQQFLIVEMDGFLCALVVDAVVGPGTAVPDSAWPDAAGAAGYVDGVVRLPDGLCLVVDPARFLFDHERAQLTQALGAAGECH
ncbi:chemotaxis protein CheW [Telluria mixta]|uniref:Chemotaxis protein CheW n=1 Tax=Telluria mixta TaxID=34071 RepID=A0ABT2BZ46_9BURK|nr:chemotaxis protein CheW [Telluria mixta]MCS0630404.1 chemotaxis protein CheW [Telluria mixta]WEM94292.1 chemotaxis protein CheW [Telluria mixta]